MSRSVDLFIATGASVEEVAGWLPQALPGSSVRPGERPGTWLLEKSGLVAELGPHAYMDDDDLPLRTYAWALSCRVDDGRRLNDAPETVMLRLVADGLHGRGITTLLVHDLQYRDRPAAPAASA